MLFFCPFCRLLYFCGGVFEKTHFRVGSGNRGGRSGIFKYCVHGVQNFFHGKVYSVFLLPFLTLDGVVYDWRLHLETTEIFLAVFIVFSALMSLLFVKDFLPAGKVNSFVISLLGLTSFLIIGIGAKNMFQFFIGWDLSVLFAYLLLMLFHEKQAVRRSGVNFLIWHTLSDIPLFCAFYMLAGKTGGFSLLLFR